MESLAKIDDEQGHDAQTDETSEAPCILLVDDHRVTASIEKNYFVGAGFRVKLAVSSLEVKRAVVDSEIDLVMIDLSFGKDSGLELIRQVKKLSCNKNIKVLATSVTGASELKAAALAAGADKFFTKPAPRMKVLKEIKSLTEQKARDFERIKQKVAVSMSIANTKYAANSLDLSEDGIHLNCEQFTPEIGVNVILEMILPEVNHKVSLSGEVVRHTKEGFGVKFGDISRSVKRILDKFLLIHSMESKASQYYL